MKQNKKQTIISAHQKQAVFVDPLGTRTVTAHKFKCIIRITPLTFNEVKQSINVSLLFVFIFFCQLNYATEAHSPKDVEDKQFNTLLLFGAINASDSLERIKHLLDIGANPDGNEFKRQSPLFNSISQNRIDIAKLLLSRGANANITYKNYDQATALEHVCQRLYLYPTSKLQKIKGQKQKDQAVYAWFNLLIDFGADPTKHDKNNVPIVHCLARYTHNTELFDLLEQYGVDLNEVRNRNNKDSATSTIGEAVTQHNFYLVSYLVNKKVDLSFDDYEDVKYMMLSYKRQKKKKQKHKRFIHSYKYLKEALINALPLIANINDGQELLNDYLIFAIKWNNPSLLEQAISKGAQINGQFKYGSKYKALELAKKYQHSKLIKIIKHYQNKQQGQFQ